jgi:hypothetical protein
LRNATWIIVLGFLLFGANEVLGCTCGVSATPQSFDGAQAVSTGTNLKSQKAKDLVLVGTVTEIHQRHAARSLKNWAVVVRIAKVVSGEFSGKTFTFAIHSPARAGLQVGQTYTIKATWTDKGYVVDEEQWRKRAK